MNGNAPSTSPLASDLFTDLPCTPEAHFRIYFFGAILVLLDHLAASLESWKKVLEKFPFLTIYNDELAQRLEGVMSTAAIEGWWKSLDAWEENVSSEHLPLRALRVRAGFDHCSIATLLTVDLVEDDARFGTLFETVQSTPGLRRPTLAFIRRMWEDHLSRPQLNSLLSTARQLGLLQVLNPDAPRPEWILSPPSWAGDLLRSGETNCLPDSLTFRPPRSLPTFDGVVFSFSVRSQFENAASIVKSGRSLSVILRGPHRNGRHTGLAALARELGFGVLEVRKNDSETIRQAETTALLLHAVPVLELDLAPGETAVIPAPALNLPLRGTILGKHGAIESLGNSGHTITIDLPLPDPEIRALLWERFAFTKPVPDESPLNLRLTSGTLFRLAQAAVDRSAISEGAHPNLSDALRSIQSRAIETLARRVPPPSSLAQLNVWDRTLDELRHFESRCRHREHLPGFASRKNFGVRALFHGPSGTGKTLAAAHSAAVLGRDLYQLDLSAVVNKYIGETEKNLNRVFDLAEELDIILLLDEGDALLTRRTDVQSANDRYANLETNFLLQRLESFEGIVIITTNTRDRIDPAFERRMDVVVEFALPAPEERRAIWHTHLPASHSISGELIDDLSARCALTGGQIRNATLHATLLALDNGGIITPEYLQSAVRREYQKLGATCPLR